MTLHGSYARRLCTICFPLQFKKLVDCFIVFLIMYITQGQPVSFYIPTIARGGGYGFTASTAAVTNTSWDHRMEGSREEKGAKSLSVEPMKERRGSYLSTIQETGHRHLNAKKFQEVAHLTCKDGAMVQGTA
jgi:hypothetical protein